MKTQTLLEFTLFLHFLGFVMGGGTLLGNLVAFKHCWKLFDADRQGGTAAFKVLSRLQIVGMIGILLLIITGVIMLWMLEWTFVSLLWFQIKLALVVLIFVNGFTIGRSQTLKLQSLLSGEKDRPIDTQKLRANLRVFQSTQLLIFLVIVFLSVVSLH
jgi:hypothetical protein